MTYHQRIINLSGRAKDQGYVTGHRDARHGAAEIASEADSEIQRLREALARKDGLLRDIATELAHTHGWRALLDRIDAELAKDTP